MAESTNALPMLPHYQKISQMVPGADWKIPQVGVKHLTVWLGKIIFQSQIWSVAHLWGYNQLTQTGHWGDCRTSIGAIAVLHPLSTPAWPQRGLTPRAKWLAKEKWSSPLLSQKLKPGLAWHKNSLKKPRSHLSQHFASAMEQRWQICHWLHSITFLQDFMCCLQKRCLCSGF